MEVIIEVATSRMQGQHYRAASAGTFGQALAGASSGWISIAGDVEAREAWRQDERREVVGGQSCHHRHGRHDRFQREHGLDALAGEQHFACFSEADAIAKEMSERLARGADWGLAAPRNIEPSALNASNSALKVRDGS